MAMPGIDPGMAGPPQAEDPDGPPGTAPWIPGSSPGMTAVGAGEGDMPQLWKVVSTGTLALMALE